MAKKSQPKFEGSLASVEKEAKEVKAPEAKEPSKEAKEAVKGEKFVDPVKGVSRDGVAIFHEGMHPRTLRLKGVK